MQQESHITLPMKQFNMLLEEIRGLKNQIANIEAKTDNIHRIFNQAEPIKPVKKLSPRQQRAKDLRDEIDREKALIAIQINQM